MFSKKKNYDETIYDGAIGTKETSWDSSTDMKSWLVGLLKQAKNRVSDWSFRRTLISSPLSPSQKISVGLIPAENKRTQLCFQRELSLEKSQSLHSQTLPRWAQQIYATKEKIRYS